MLTRALSPGLLLAVALVGLLAAGRMLGALRRRRPPHAHEPGGPILILNWRDTGHPQGGGSEVFVEEVARRLAAGGRPVTVFCAAHPHAPSDEWAHGVRFVRRGSWRTVYLWGALYHLLGRFGAHDVVVDVQNGIPFFTPLYCRRPVVALVHHVHREQWRMLFPRPIADFGWWVESRLAPRLYRRAHYVAVSDATRDDVTALGVDPARISVVRNGAPGAARHAPGARAPAPTVIYLGRLVPHKRIELLFEAAAELRLDLPGLQVLVAGRGLWEDRLRDRAEQLGLGEVVRFEGFVDEGEKRRLLAESWVLAMPSIREGWGLAVMEAAAAGTPAVAFSVGGLNESIIDGRTGFLAVGQDGFTAALRSMLTSAGLRARLGREARAWSARFCWDATARDFDAVLQRAAARGRIPTVETVQLPLPVGEAPAPVPGLAADQGP